MGERFQLVWFFYFILEKWDWGKHILGKVSSTWLKAWYEMAGWHHWLDGRKSESTPGVGDGQGGLKCCNSWGHKESDTTERLNWTELNWKAWYKIGKYKYFTREKGECYLVQLNKKNREREMKNKFTKKFVKCCRSVQFSSVAQSCLTLCDPMNRSTPGLPVHH